MNVLIALDGPGGAGKSTVADDVAAKLGILHLDTGAMYRAFTYRAMKNGVSTQDEAALTELAEHVHLDVRFENNRQRTLVDGEDVTDLIRTPEISMGTSNCSRFAAVRSLMVRMQQELASKQSMILDGRDIGTKVLPNATLKVYLTASPETRARRRYLEMQAKGQPGTYEEVLADVVQRDHQDTTRAIDPLRPAADAVTVDTSEMTQQEAVAQILKLLEERA